MHFCRRAQCYVSRQPLLQRGGIDQVDLVDHQQHAQRSARQHFGQPRGDDLVFGGWAAVGFHQPQHHVGVLQHVESYLVHILAQLVDRVVNARRIDEHDLPFGESQDA